MRKHKSLYTNHLSHNHCHFTFFNAAKLNSEIVQLTYFTIGIAISMKNTCKIPSKYNEKTIHQHNHPCHPEPNSFAARPERQHIENFARHLSQQQVYYKVTINQYQQLMLSAN